jgi:predicted nucleotidyltransferase
LKVTLSAFVERLRAALGENLISVVLYGGAARGVFDEAASDANVMLVLREVKLPLLGSIADEADVVRREFALTLLTLTESDLADSREVFPTKFLDIRRHHEILWGRDVASALVVPRERLERQARRELMNLQLRLRQLYLESRRRPEQLAAMLRRSTTTLILNLGVLLEAATGQPCEGHAATLAAAGAAGLDRARLEEFLDFKSGRRCVETTELEGVYEAFMCAVEAALSLGQKNQ